MVDVKKFSEIDIYGLLEVEISATEQEASDKYDKLLRRRLHHQFFL